MTREHLSRAGLVLSVLALTGCASTADTPGPAAESTATPATTTTLATSAANTPSTTSAANRSTAVTDPARELRGRWTGWGLNEPPSSSTFEFLAGGRVILNGGYNHVTYRPDGRLVLAQEAYRVARYETGGIAWVALTGEGLTGERRAYQLWRPQDDAALAAHIRSWFPGQWQFHCGPPTTGPSNILDLRPDGTGTLHRQQTVQPDHLDWSVARPWLLQIGADEYRVRPRDEASDSLDVTELTEKVQCQLNPVR